MKLKPLAQISADKPCSPKLSNLFAKNVKYSNWTDFVKKEDLPLNGRTWNERLAEILRTETIIVRAFGRIKKNSVQLVLDGSESNSYGHTESYGANLTVRIFLQTTKSPEVTEGTILHEARHVKRQLRHQHNSIQEEVIAHSLEFVYKFGRRPTKKERRRIKDIIRQIPEYADLPEK